MTKKDCSLRQKGMAGDAEMKMPHREFRSGLISILARYFNVL